MIKCPARKPAGFFLRFTIRDLFWLTALVAIVTIGLVDRGRQSARMQALEELTHLEAQQIFPNNWDGKVGAFRNQIAILGTQVSDLTSELESRGHRVEIGDCSKVVVDAHLLCHPLQRQAPHRNLHLAPPQSPKYLHFSRNSRKPRSRKLLRRP